MSQFEDKLSESWPKCLGGDKAAFRAMTTFYRIMRRAAEENNSEVLLIDVGPNLGTINRAALIAAEYIVMPLAPGLFSLQGLKNLGPTITRWRKEFMGPGKGQVSYFTLTYMRYLICDMLLKSPIRVIRSEEKKET